jgi:hypothetical protein
LPAHHAKNENNLTTKISYNIFSRITANTKNQELYDLFIVFATLENVEIQTKMTK